jgi:hypothetical protein
MRKIRFIFSRYGIKKILDFDGRSQIRRTENMG